MRWNTFWPASLLGLLLLGSILPVYEGHRALQLAVLALPPLLWLRLPVSSTALRSRRFVVVSCVVASFIINGAVRGFVRHRYEATPESSLIRSAVANTSIDELQQYLSSSAWALAPIVAVTAIACVAAACLVWVCGRHRRMLDKPEKWVWWVSAGLSLVALLIQPWRRHHPVLAWIDWGLSVQDLRRDWSDQGRQRAAMIENASRAGVSLTSAAPSTVVLVLTDSVNRDNMSLYGYARRTTPQLSALQAMNPERFLAIRHAWSVESGTIASLSGLFTFGLRMAHESAGRSQHVLALAKAAGYKVWWMSNHDDVAVEQQHAQLADVVEMINRSPGRSTSSLDGELLDCLEEALADLAPRKLVVVHFLGAHPHYSLRSPDGFEPFGSDHDEIERALTSEGRPFWLRAARRAYDRAVAYQDAVAAESLRLTQRYKPAEGRAAWMYMSDHGQEVGHNIAHAGHSPGTAAGYRIPALIWRSADPFDPMIRDRAFRADWAAHSLVSLMDFQWDGARGERDVLNVGYRWQAPRLQAPVTRFD